MSNASSAITFALGAGSGLAAWHLLRDKLGSAIQAPSTATTPQAATPRSCAIRLEPTALTADGVPVSVRDAVDRCKAAGRAEVTIVPGAPAATYAELMVALGRAGVPTSVRRNAGRAPASQRARNVEIASTFTLAVYPHGLRGPKRVHWFYAEPPTSWTDARDRLAAAGLIDPHERSPHMPGAWRLVTDPRVFDKERAKPLPGGRAAARDAARAGRYALEGRRILRDGEPIVLLERIDLGDERYAITPHEADVLAKRIVALLNKRRRRPQAPCFVGDADRSSGGARG